MSDLPKPIKLEGNRITLFKKKHGKGANQGNKADKIIKNWYAKIRVDTGVYKVASTNEEDVERAKVKAVQLAYKYQARHEQGLALKEDTFKFIAEGYYKLYKAECKAKNRLKYYRESRSFYKKVLASYFGNRKITGISSKDIYELFNHRQSTATNRSGDKLSNSRLSKERGYLNAIFNHALATGYLNRIPEFPKIGNKDAFNPRPSLSEAEWIKFNSVLKDFHLDLPESQEKQRFQRECLRDWCQVIAYSGIRTGEASRLKWKDWQSIKEDGQEYAIITIRAEEQGASKTGFRQVVAIKYVNTALARRKSKSQFIDDDDYIFANYNTPDPILSFKKSFNSALEKAGIGFKNGKRLKGYTPYILRHTAASLALTHRNVDIYALALNLGNSTPIVEKFYSKATPLDFKSQLGNLKED